MVFKDFDSVNMQDSFIQTIEQHHVKLIIATTIAFLSILITRFQKRKPRLLADAPYVGLANGSRSLTDARRRYQTHAAEMLIEGYREVSESPDHFEKFIPIIRSFF